MNILDVFHALSVGTFCQNIAFYLCLIGILTINLECVKSYRKKGSRFQ